MARKVLRRVLSFAKRHVGWRLHDGHTRGLRLLEVAVDIVYRDMDILRHVRPVRGTKWTALATEHDGAFAYRKLRVAYDAITFSSKALKEAERFT